MKNDDTIVAMIRATRALCGMPVVLHDYLSATRLPLPMRFHMSAPCLEAKSTDNNRRCGAFCGASGVVDGRIETYPEGYVHRCPFGAWKIAVPLHHDSLLAGILFAGPAPRDRAGPEWLEHCRLVLTAVAARIARLVSPESWGAGQADRRRSIMDFVNTHFDSPATLRELARHLHLSPSRTRHLVVELFGQPFSKLSMEIRLRRSAAFLELTELPISDIALRMGFCDTSHFSRAFSRMFGVSPRVYRRRAGGAAPMSAGFGPSSACARVSPAEQ
ncbi:MAG: helix-turn-helix domain-containing protein [Chitinivibrionales bacterium]|nr:helix-turn-helix domain-containing protein [Chitinivibrionales bacterium]